MRRRFAVAMVSSLVLAGAIPLLAGSGAASAGATGPVAQAVTTTTVAPNLASVHVRLQLFASGLTSPVAMAFRAGDNRAYVAQQAGTVVIVSAGHIVATVLNITPYLSHGNEQGLLGLTFSKDGTKMYIDYTDVNGDIHIVEFTMQGDRVNLQSRRQLMFTPHPVNTNHNGGQVTIGPDNMLYIAFGDGGGAGDPLGNAQKLTTRLGKILRIDPRPTGTAQYGIPADNPFASRTGVTREIWMYGLRNPWRWSFDKVTRDMWIGDVGQALYEEVDFAAAGQKGINWGWNKREGFHPYNGGAKPAGARDPILERSHALGDCAVTGGYVYRSTANPIPGLRGGYVFGDFCTGDLRAVAEQGGVVTQNQDLGVNVPQLTSFGEGPAGGLYAISRAGNIYFIAAA